MNKKRVAIVTGATRGIGRGIFARLISEGVSVATVYHRDDQAAELFADKSAQTGVPCLIEKIDVADYDSRYQPYRLAGG